MPGCETISATSGFTAGAPAAGVTTCASGCGDGRSHGSGGGLTLRDDACSHRVRRDDHRLGPPVPLGHSVPPEHPFGSAREGVAHPVLPAVTGVPWLTWSSRPAPRSGSASRTYAEAA